MHWQQLLDLSEQKSIQQARTLFDRDYDRIIFSHPFRKLQDKTQVHPLPEHDFVHNRLTHSLEVSSVGRSLGRLVGDSVLERRPEMARQISANDFGTIVASASLAHDIGNPPFGHSGEQAISEYFLLNAKLLESEFTQKEWADLVNFEGNAQGFRLLNKSGYQGLKLTAPTLAAFTKYPRPALVSDAFKPRRSQKKYGFYVSEADLFKEMAHKLGLKALAEEQWTRHPLAFLVEAADDICYHVIDLEDGCNLGLLSQEDTIELYAQVIGERFDRNKLYTIRSKREQIAVLRALAISELIDQCKTLFLDSEEDILSGKFDVSLTDAIPAADHLAQISKISVQNIYRSRTVLEIEAAGFTVINGLLEAFVPAACSIQKGKQTRKEQVCYRLLPEDTRYEIEQAPTVYLALRALLDFVSGLTDSNAMNLYRKIGGIALPGKI